MLRKSLCLALTAVLCLVLTAVLCLAGCGAAGIGIGQPGDGEETGKLKVATTLFPYYDFIRQTAGDLVDLQLVIPAGMDSHSFEPTPADMRRIQEADVLICNGGAMEEWLADVLGAVDTQDITIVTMMDYVDAFESEVVEGMEHGDHDHSHDHGSEICELENHDHGTEICGLEGHSHVNGFGSGDQQGEYKGYIEYDGFETEIEYDEHIWTSPVNAIKMVDVICQTLMAEDPEHGDLYRERAEAYQTQLRRIDEELRQVSADRKRNMIVVADKFPFRYLAEEYQLDYRAAFSGCSTDTEPSARTIAYLIDKMKELAIPAVYYLELSSQRVAEIIGEETGAQPLLLHSCHNVTRAQFDRGVTYVELMERNIENLRVGLNQ